MDSTVQPPYPSSRRLIRVMNLDVDLAGQRVLRDITFTLHENETLGLIGPNGGGKTTLLRTIIGLVRPSAGRIAFAGSQQPNGVERPRVGYLPQGEVENLRSFPIRTYDLALLGAEGEAVSAAGPKEESHRRARIALRDMGLAQQIWSRPISALSGGQRRRALLAMMLSGENKLLLLDEPCESLDHPARRKLYQALQRIRDHREVGTMIATHDSRLLREVDSVIAVDGRIAARGTPEQLLHNGEGVLRQCGMHEGFAGMR